jgi:peptidoglycan/xylan/chitin deacetylase (PgdA/CDA1 family)
MNSLIWKRRLGNWLGPIYSANNRDIILLYHSVGSGRFSVPYSIFRQQMDWLVANARVISLSELIGSSNAGRLRVAISFDDGYESLHRVVLPILSERDFPAVVYLNSGLLGDDDNPPSQPELGHYPDERFLSWMQVQDLVQAGWSAGGHGVEHVDLTRLQTGSVMDQITRCKAEIETHLGRPCEHFSYTWGRYDLTTKQAVASSGFHSAASGLHGAVRTSSDRFALPRIDIRVEYDLTDFIDVVTGRWDWLGTKQRLDRWLR